MERCDILEGVVAFIQCCQPSGPVDARVVLRQKLESLGARICHRLGKDTTHVVFQKRHQGSDDDRQSEATLLLELYERANKVGVRAVRRKRPLLWLSCKDQGDVALLRYHSQRLLPADCAGGGKRIVCLSALGRVLRAREAEGHCTPVGDLRKAVKVVCLPKELCWLSSKAF